jgi:hypothetical protein
MDMRQNQSLIQWVLYLDLKYPIMELITQLVL